MFSDIVCRYELKHKRMMLEELKKELEICREQWEEARQKNSQTEEDWKVLRSEFASRKRKQCNSTESGYEDEEASESPVELPTSPLPESRASPLPEEEGDMGEEWQKGKLEDGALGWKGEGTKESSLPTEEDPQKEPVPGTSHLDSEPPKTSSTDRVIGLPDDLGMEIRVPVLKWETDPNLDSTRAVSESIPSNSETQMTRVLEPLVEVSEPSSSKSLKQELQENRVPEDNERRIPDPLTKDKEEDVPSGLSVEDTSIPNLGVTTDLESKTTSEDDQKRIPDLLTKEDVASTSGVEDSRIPNLEVTSLESTTTSEDGQTRMSSGPFTKDKVEDVASNSRVEDSRIPNLEVTSLESTTTSEDDQKRTPDPLTKAKDGVPEDSRIPNLEATMDLLQMEIRVPVLAWETEAGPSSSQQEQNEVPSQVPTPPPPPPMPADLPQPPPRRRTAEEVLAGREARLRRLEEQCQSLFSKMSSTSQRSDLISNRLEQLHEQYGDQQQPSTSRQPDQQ
jgi:hypothetical protein